MTAPGVAGDVGHLLRELAPQVLGALARRHGDFAAAEDAMQEALIAAAEQWSTGGVPANPRGWLYRAAAEGTASIPERDFLLMKAARLVASARDGAAS